MSLKDRFDRFIDYFTEDEDLSLPNEKRDEPILTPVNSTQDKALSTNQTPRTSTTSTKETNITINDNSSFTISYTIPSFSSSNKKRFDEIIETTISILKKNFYNSNVILMEKEEEFSNFENFNYKEKFDVVLADVPCSGIGILRRKPEIR